MIALTAIGNRTWGAGVSWAPSWLGAVIMAIGLWIGSDYPPFAIPALFAGVFFWRAWPIGAFLDMEGNAISWAAAYERNLAIIPLIAMCAEFQASLLPLVTGTVAFALIPVAYYLSGKQTKYDATAIAEMVSGALIGLLSVSL